jgi:uncharacterized membrane protein YbhN (UPF0104 family)
MPKKLRLLSIPLMIAAVVALGYYLYLNASSLYSSVHLNFYWLGPLGMLVLARFYLNSVINQIALAELGARTSALECFSLTSIASGLQMLLPLNTGALFRAVYLKRRYQLAYTHFLSTQFGIQILGILITCAAAVLTLTFLSDPQDPAILSGIVLTGGCFCMAFVLLFFPRIRRRNHRLWDKIAMVSEGCHALQNNRSLLMKLILISFAKTACDALVYWSGALSLGLDISLLGALALTSVASLAACFRITPGALGTYEALIGLVSQAATLTSVQAISISLATRGMGYAVVLLLFPFCSWWLMSRYGFRWNESESTTVPSLPESEPLSQAA